MHHGLRRKRRLLRLPQRLPIIQALEGQTRQWGGSFRDSGIVKQETGTDRVSPNKDRGIQRVAVVGRGKNKWQPVGDSNPCDKTENLAS